MNRKICLILGCLLWCSQLLWAEEQKLVLSLEEAQEYAVQNNKSLKNASIEVRKAYAQRWQTIAQMLPQADMSLGLQHTSGTMKFALQDGMPPMERDMKNTAGTLGVSATMAINGQLIVGALLNNLAIEMQNISLEQSEDNLRANVMQSYVSVLIMQDIVALLDSSLVNIEHLAEMTQRTVDVGAAEQTAADQIVVKANALKNSINSNRRNIELAFNSLKILLGVGADVEIELTQSFDELLSAGYSMQLLAESFALERNHNFQLLVKNTELARKNVIMAGMEYVPTLSAFYQYTAPNKYFKGQSPMEQSMGVVGLQLSIPLWSSGKRASKITEKKLDYEAAQNTLEETKENLMIQHQQLCFNLSNAYETYCNEKENIEVSKRIFKNTTNKYEQGVASSLELTNASNDLISAQSTYSQAMMSLVSAQVELVKFLNK